MAGEVTEIEHRVAVAKRLAANIREHLGGLTPEQWELPSACAEWQVQDVVSHLIGGAERQAESMERGRGLRPARRVRCPEGVGAIRHQRPA